MIRNNFLFIAIFLFFVKAEGQMYNFKNYSVEDGIAQSQIYSIVQDYRGFLWFGSRGGGVTVFNGLQFKTLTEKDGLINNYIYSIKQDQNKQLWFATNNGISKYNGIKFQNYKIDNQNNIHVYQIAFDANHSIWLATSKGLYHFERNKFTSISKELKLSAQNVNAVYVASKNKIYYGDRYGLHLLTIEGKKLKVHHYSSDSRFMNNSITAIHQDKKGNLWLGTYGDGAYQFDGKRFKRFDYGQELYNTSVLNIYEDKEGLLWFATLDKGLLNYQVDNGNFNYLNESMGLSNNHVRCIIQDNIGNFWIGTSGGGVCNYFGKLFTTYDKNAGLGGSFIYSIYRDSKKRLWVGNSQKGVSFLKEGKFYNFNQQNGFLDVKVKAIVEDDEGAMYFGTEGKGLYRCIDSSFTALKQFKNCYVKALRKDKQGNIWVATAGNGIFKLQLEGKNWQLENFKVSTGLLSNRITCLSTDQKGNIWYGTENDGLGVMNIHGKSIKKWTIKRGMSSNSIRCVEIDAKNNVWVGTAGAGINKLNGDNLSQKPSVFDYKNGLTSTNIYLITFDALGHLLVGTEKGLDILTFRENGGVLKVKNFNKGDGFTGVETCQNAVYKDYDGSFWFGTINGLIQYQAKGQTKNTIPPIIQISNVKLYYESIADTKYRKFIGDWNSVDELNLPYTQNHITFDFFAVNLSNPQAVKYKWKLKGFDEKWSPASVDQSILYSNLNPGKYTFFVKASNEDGIWTKHAATIHFTIRSPFWYAWWFISIVSISSILGIYYIVKWRFNRIHLKTLEANKQLQLEKDVVELSQKALRLQMNPHFIFNALNSIQSQIGTGKDKEARYYLAKFSRLMRQILDNSRNENITLQEEINTLENYLLIEKFCNGDRFDYSITVPENFETDFIRIPPMLIQPFVENAIKHGLRDMDVSKKRGTIHIAFYEEEERMICEIVDNGIGRVKANENNAKSKETYHQSTALNVTQERLDLMKDESQNGSLEIIDLYENEEAIGTKVKIIIPNI